MGYVMKTTNECVGEAYQSESLHFETYEDFVKYSSVLDDKTEGHSVILTDQQIYKLRIILGHVLGDKDCYEINEQLDFLCGSELDCEDYDKLFFTFKRGDERVVLEDGEKKPQFNLNRRNKMQKTEKKFMQAAKNLRAWACIDSEAGVVGVFETREEARSNKRYAESHGHKQKIAKLVFEDFVR